jgi:hypothetical protein
MAHKLAASAWDDGSQSQSPHTAPSQEPKESPSLSPRVAQKAAGGLFGDESAQLDLVDQARKPAPAQEHKWTTTEHGTQRSDSGPLFADVWEMLKGQWHWVLNTERLHIAGGKVTSEAAAKNAAATRAERWWPSDGDGKDGGPPGRLPRSGCAVGAEATDCQHRLAAALKFCRWL